MYMHICLKPHHTVAYLIQCLVLTRWLNINLFCCVSYFTGPPALMVNILTNTESSSIVVQWDGVDDSLTTTYAVTWASERDHGSKGYGIVSPTSSYTITGLTLDTVYTITLTANNICGVGPEYRTNVSLFASTNPSIVITSAISMYTATNVITYPTSTVNPADTTTADESSKFSSNSIYFTDSHVCNYVILHSV